MLNKYIDFIITQIISDAQFLDYSYGLNFLIIPYVYWLLFFILKYLILSSPIWVPLNIITSTLGDSFKKIQRNLSKK